MSAFDLELIVPSYATEIGTIDIGRVDADRDKLGRLNDLLSEIEILAETPSMSAATAILERIAVFAEFKNVANGALRHGLAEKALYCFSAVWAKLAEETRQPAVDIGAENIRSLAAQQCVDLPWLCADAKAILKHIERGDLIAAWKVCRHRLACDEIVQLRTA